MPGSGKTVFTRVARELGLPVVVMGDIVREEVERRGMKPTPESFGKVMLDLRRRHGKGVIAIRCIPRILESQSRVVIVDGVRSMEEVEEFRKAFPEFVLVAVHSSPKTRFRRIYARGRRDDSRAWRGFKRRDDRELRVGIGSAIASAELMLVNEGSLERFEEEVKQVLRRLGEVE